MKKIQAAGSNILVLVVNPREEKTTGGIVLPEGGKSRGVLLFGRVRHVGPDVQAKTVESEGLLEDAPLYAVDDMVIFERASAFEVPGGTATLALLPADAVLATVFEDGTPEPIILPATEMPLDPNGPNRLVRN